VAADPPAVALDDALMPCAATAPFGSPTASTNIVTAPAASSSVITRRFDASDWASALTTYVRRVGDIPRDFPDAVTVDLSLDLDIG